MHIIEGFLPFEWCLIWYVISIIFIVIGIRQIKRLKTMYCETGKLLLINGIVMFVMSLFHTSSVTGSSSHPTANGLTGSLFGPAVTSVVAAIVLILQAFLFAFGGITTLGASIFSIGVVGPFAACLAYNGARKINIPDIISLIFAVIIANIATFTTTAVQFALVYGDFYTIFAVFLVFQIPWLIIDIIVSSVVFVILKSRFKDSGIFSQDLNDFLQIK